MLHKIYLSSLFIINYIFWGLITWGEHVYLLMLSLSSAFIISYLIFKKKNNQKKEYFFLNMSFFLIILITCLVGKDFSRGLLYLIFTPISSYLALLYCKKNKLIIPIFSILLFLIVGFYLQTNYFIYYHNKNAEKNLPFAKITVYDANGKRIELKNNKIIVLDFWSTTCGICFKKFPALEETYLKYKDNANVEIYALNVPLRNDNFIKTSKILDSIGYKFPKIYAKSAKEIKDSLCINSFPHLIILKNGRIRYDGMLETEKNVLIYNIETEIEKLLHEKK